MLLILGGQGAKKKNLNKGVIWYILKMTFPCINRLRGKYNIKTNVQETSVHMWEIEPSDRRSLVKWGRVDRPVWLGNFHLLLLHMYVDTMVFLNICRVGRYFCLHWSQRIAAQRKWSFCYFQWCSQVHNSVSRYLIGGGGVGGRWALRTSCLKLWNPKNSNTWARLHKTLTSGTRRNNNGN